jgi:membrane-bound ClpP family serine protease
MILQIAIITILMLIAIVLILLEIFLLPGITLAGIGGALFATAGIIYAYNVGDIVGHLTLLISPIAFIVAFVWLMRSRSLRKVALKTDVDSKLTSSRELGIKPGDEGITLSRLAPIGKALINDVEVEAKSTGEFIDENTPVKVLRVDGYNVLVTRIEPSETHA